MSFTRRRSTVAAIDLGASSGRVMVGQVGPNHLELHSVSRFANDPVRLPDGLHWNPLELYRQAVDGLSNAVSQSADGLDSVAVDSWAVDYALMRGSHLLGVPFHYRDCRAAGGVERIHERVPFEQLYDRNGLQFLPFNTLYQLATEDRLDEADRLLLIPDLVGFWLTGRMVTERTNASTTGLLSPVTREWDDQLLESTGLPRHLFTELVDPGTRIGTVSATAADRIGQVDLSLIAVGSHDTASAVVAVPMLADDTAYISCGTWALVGVELDKPVMTDEARAANFTNEGGVDGTTRFLTNVMGTWLISETLRTWERGGSPVELTTLLEAAAEVTGTVTIFDVQDPSFMPPGDMPARIHEWCVRRGERTPVGKAVLMRSIIESLAEAFARTVDVTQKLTDRPVRNIHIVGGGSLNRLLCQSLADRSGRTVVAGPVEATAIGNVLVQARALGATGSTLTDLRELVSATHDLPRFEPRS